MDDILLLHVDECSLHFLVRWFWIHKSFRSCELIIKCWINAVACKSSLQRVSKAILTMSFAVASPDIYTIGFQMSFTNLSFLQ